MEAAKLLGGTGLAYGQASAEVPALAGVPLAYILWTERGAAAVSKHPLRRVSKLISERGGFGGAR